VTLTFNEKSTCEQCTLFAKLGRGCGPVWASEAIGKTCIPVSSENMLRQRKSWLRVCATCSSEPVLLLGSSLRPFLHCSNCRSGTLARTWVLHVIPAPDVIAPGRRTATMEIEGAVFAEGWGTISFFHLTQRFDFKFFRGRERKGGRWPCGCSLGCRPVRSDFSGSAVVLLR